MDPYSNFNLFLSNTTQVDETVYGMPTWAAWLIIAILLIVSGVFSASENAFSNCNKYHFKVLADEGKLTAKIIVKLVEKFDNTLITVLVGNNIVQTLMTTFSTVLFYNIFINTYQEQVVGIISTIVMACLIYVISDTVPKILSKTFPNRMAYILAWPDIICYYLLFPVIYIFSLILKAVHKIFKIKEDNIFTKEEFIEQADTAINDENINEKEESLFEPNELNILKRAFALDSIKISNILTPKDKIVSIDLKGLTTDSLNKFIMSNVYSRFPVYFEDKDNIIGILNVNSYFKEFTEDPHLDIRSCLTQPIYVKETDSIPDIFEQLNSEKVHIAIVKNDQDEVVGMITMEDLLDELVGEQVFAQSSAPQLQKENQ